MKEKVMQGKPYAGNPHVRFDEGAGAPARSGRPALLYRRFILWLAWKIDHACHSVIEKLDPIPDEAIREVMKELRVACERAKMKAKMRAERKDSANLGHGRRKWLVSIYEERRIQIEVEADNGAEAKDTAIDAYVNDDDLRDDMLKEEALLANRVCVEKDIGPANGIVAERKCEG